MKKILGLGVILWIIVFLSPLLIPLYSAQTPVIEHINDSTGRRYNAPIPADSADAWVLLTFLEAVELTDSAKIAFLEALELTDSARIAILEALELTDSARIGVLEALELTDSANTGTNTDDIATLAALELTDSANTKVNTDSSALYSSRTQGLSETGGVSKLLNDFTIVSNSNKDSTSVETDIIYNSGLSLDLDYYYNRNIVPFICYTGAYTWAAYNSGVTAEDNTTYKTDGASVKITIASSGTFQGASIDITDWDAEVWRDKDASTTADYIIFAINIATQDITDLGTSELELLMLSTNASPDTTDGWRYELSTPSNGWNYYKVAKSAFTEIGTGDWGDITWVLVRNNLTATSAEVIFYVDVGQMVRKAVGGAWPSPFQREDGNGSWWDEWENESSHNVWLVEESGQLGMMSPDVTSSRLESINTFGDFRASGTTLVKGSSTSFFYLSQGADQFIVSSNTLTLNGVGASPTTTFTNSVGDLVHWRYIRQGTSITGQVSHTGLSGDWTTLSTDCSATASTFRIYAYSERQLSFNLSTVAYADHARIADGLLNKNWEIVKDSLWLFIRGKVFMITLADSMDNPF